MRLSIRLILVVLSGVLMSLAWLGFPGWIMFVALIPLLIVEDFFTVNKAKYKSVVFWFHGLLTFLIWNSLTTWWIAHATVIGALLAIVVNSFLMSIVWWLAHIMHRNFKSSLGYFALIAFWISFEYFHYHWEIEWPWLNMGNAFANDIKLVQWYEFTGVLGGTFWVLLLNLLIYNFYKNYRQKKQFNFSTLIMVILLVALPMLISHRMYSNYKESIHPKQFVLVQPNVNPYSEKYDLKSEKKKLNNLIQLANSKIDSTVDFVVGPETVFERTSDWNEDRLHYNIIYNTINSWLQDNPQINFIFGTSTSKFYPTANYTKTTRTRNGYHYDIFNTAFMIKNQQKDQIYHKSILVNGVEKIPFMRYLSGLKKIFINLGGASGSLGRQEESLNFTTHDGVTVAPVICYESIFGAYVGSYARKGAQAIVIITNDGWWKNTPGYKQHMSFARLRAIETRRSIARSANTGISCFINQRGDVLEKTDWWVPASIKGTINLNDKITFYVRYGDYIARISVFVSVLLLLNLIVTRLKRT